MRADGLSYVDAVYGREADTSTVGPHYTGVMGVLEFRSIRNAAGDIVNPEWVQGQPPSVRIYATDFSGGWFVLTDEGELLAIAKDYDPPASLVEQTRQWMALNREIVAWYFLYGDFHGGWFKMTTDGEIQAITVTEEEIQVVPMPAFVLEHIKQRVACNPEKGVCHFYFGGTVKLLDGLRHRLSGKTRIALALEKFAERTDALGGTAALNPWKDNLPTVQNPEKLASILVDLEELRNATSTSDEKYRKQVEDLSKLVMLNYGLILGVQEGFVLDSLEALDYLIDAKGESTVIEKAAAEQLQPDADEEA